VIRRCLNAAALKRYSIRDAIGLARRLDPGFGSITTT
jgi:hypothetical protein